MDIEIYLATTLVAEIALGRDVKDLKIFSLADQIMILQH
jgi:hypothetical protein